jgi:hypothetical protein
MYITNTNEVSIYDAGPEYADPNYTDPEYCECEFPTETSTAPVMCLNCRHYIDPSRLIANGDGSYRIAINL